MINIQEIKNEINKLIKYNKEKADIYGEVYTEFYLVEEHVSNIDELLFIITGSTFLDPCAGFGNYSIILIEKLMEGLKSWEPDEEERYQHIIENQIYMVEIQKESCEVIKKLFNPEGKYKLNLYNMSFFDFEEELKVQQVQEDINSDVDMDFWNSDEKL